MEGWDVENNTVIIKNLSLLLNLETDRVFSVLVLPFFCSSSFLLLFFLFSFFFSSMMQVFMLQTISECCNILKLSALRRVTGLNELGFFFLISFLIVLPLSGLPLLLSLNSFSLACLLNIAVSCCSLTAGFSTPFLTFQWLLCFAWQCC